MDHLKLSSAEQTQVANIEKQSGKTMEEWIRVVHSSGLQKHGEIVSMLKEKHGFTHGNANMVVHWAKQSFAGATDDDALIEAQYKGKETLRPLYEQIMNAVKSFGPDVEPAPKKGYMSLRRKKQFALIQPSTKTRLDIGLILKGVNPEGILEPGGSWNAMCTHRIKIEGGGSLPDDVLKWLNAAYDLAG